VDTEPDESPKREPFKWPARYHVHFDREIDPDWGDQYRAFARARKWPEDFIGPDAHDCWRDPPPRSRDGRVMVQVGCDACFWSEWLDVSGLGESDALALTDEAWATHEQYPAPRYGEPTRRSMRGGMPARMYYMQRWQRWRSRRRPPAERPPS
jgi:hypothetical protein